MNKQLAFFGGKPIRTKPFPSWPQFDQKCISAVQSVLESGKVNYWTGTLGREFETAFANYCGSKYGVALSNGTVALELALRIANISIGDEVIVTPRSFVASASCVLTVGATPRFADIDRDTQALSATTISEALTDKTKAIILVHLGGYPADIEPIVELAKKKNLILIEDCAQAHGAKVNGRSIGSFGDIATFSFCQDKIITTGGEGGALITNSSEFWDRAWTYKDHGKSWAKSNESSSGESFRWLHDTLGSNYRLTEMQAAMGLVLLEELDVSVQKRRRNADALNKCLSQFSAIKTIPERNGFYNSYYKLYSFVIPEKLQTGWDRDKIISAICAEGIPCLSGSCSEIYLEQVFAEQFKTNTRLPIAKELGELSVMFLVHPTISEQDLDDYQRGIEKVLSEASV